MMDVWVLRYVCGYGCYEGYHETTTIVGVYTSFKRAFIAANTGSFAMGSKLGVQWEDYKGHWSGEVETCRKGHYYMLCTCRKFENYTYHIEPTSLDKIEEWQ